MDYVCMGNQWSKGCQHSSKLKIDKHNVINSKMVEKQHISTTRDQFLNNTVQVW